MNEGKHDRARGMIFLRHHAATSQPQPKLKENRATHGPHDRAGRGQQGLGEAANIVAGQGNTVG
jgi:hypothetical protein